jgi:hypothetical protein
MHRLQSLQSQPLLAWLHRYLGKLSEEGIKGPMDLAFVAHAGA